MRHERIGMRKRHEYPTSTEVPPGVWVLHTIKSVFQPKLHFRVDFLLSNMVQAMVAAFPAFIMPLLSLGLRIVL